MLKGYARAASSLDPAGLDPGGLHWEMEENTPEGEPAPRVALCTELQGVCTGKKSSTSASVKKLENRKRECQEKQPTQVRDYCSLAPFWWLPLQESGPVDLLIHRLSDHLINMLTIQ